MAAELPPPEQQVLEPAPYNGNGNGGPTMRRSSSYLTTFPVASNGFGSIPVTTPVPAPMFSFPTDSVGPYAYSPQVCATQYQLVQQHGNNGFSQPQQCFYVVQAAPSQTPLFTAPMKAEPQFQLVPTTPSFIQLQPPKELLQSQTLGTQPYFDLLQQVESNAHPNRESPASTEQKSYVAEGNKTPPPADFSKLIFDHSSTGPFANKPSPALGTSRRNSVSSNY